MSALTVNTETVTLNNGVKIPVVGLGTWRATEADAAYNAVKTALQNGYRHIDTAAAYGNEEEVGRGIRDSGVPREEIFVTTKLNNPDHKRAAEALDDSLKKLGLEYIDLYLMHWPLSLNPNGAPNPTGADNETYTDWDWVDTYKVLQDLYKNTDKIKAIGVSNYTIPKLERLLSTEGVDVVPACNQIELHPLLPQPKLLAYLKEKKIYAQAYSPLGSSESPLFKNEEVVSIAKKLNAEPAQILVSWAVQRNTVVLPKSVTPSRVISNLKTLTLPEEDFNTLENLSQKYGTVRTCDMPEWHAFDDDVN